MTGDNAIAVALIYPEVLGTYGDRGNALALRRRAEARGFSAHIEEVPLGQPLPTMADVYLIGGSEDAAQALALQSLLDHGGIEGILHGRAPCLAVCAGFQILTREFGGPQGRRQAGLGFIDATCGRLPGPRAVGEIVTEAVGLPGVGTLTGFENHQGDAVLGPGAQPLGRMVSGVGNGHSSAEGAVQDNVVATYLHGPVLVRNPALADHLLQRVTGPLPPYDDEAVAQLRRERLSAAAHPDHPRRSLRASLARRTARPAGS